MDHYADSPENRWNHLLRFRRHGSNTRHLHRPAVWRKRVKWLRQAVRILPARGFRHLPIETRRTLVAGSESEDGVVVTVGVEGLVIVRDGEKVLVASEDAIETLREVVPELLKRGLEHLT